MSDDFNLIGNISNLDLQFDEQVAIEDLKLC